MIVGLRQRKAIFAALVALQDEGTCTVRESRQIIYKQYGITDEKLKEIEIEGVDRQWPPLNEDDGNKALEMEPQPVEPPETIEPLIFTA